MVSIRKVSSAKGSMEAPTSSGFKVTQDGVTPLPFRMSCHEPQCLVILYHIRQKKTQTRTMPTRVDAANVMAARGYRELILGASTRACDSKAANSQCQQGPLFAYLP